MQQADIKAAYNVWAQQYDTNLNKTRDLEAKALQTLLAPLSFTRCLECGCGTGKNTQWLLTKAEHITAVDLSEEMLAKAKEKINTPQVDFIQADITAPWPFAVQPPFNLITFSLMLEHIEHLHPVLHHAAAALDREGYIYIGELHPFKQYSGSKARFETEDGVQVVPCFTHHISDFTQAALDNGLSITAIHEFFDDDDRNAAPRILALLLHKA